MSGGGSGRQDWPGGSGGAAPRTRRSDGFCRLLSPARMLPQPQVDARPAAPPIGCRGPRGGAAAPPLVGRARGRGRRCEGSAGRAGAPSGRGDGTDRERPCAGSTGILRAENAIYLLPLFTSHLPSFIFRVLHPLLGKPKLAAVMSCLCYSLKLRPSKFKLKIRRNLFAERAIRHYNAVPRKVVAALSRRFYEDRMWHQCSGPGDREVFGHSLESMISDLFSNPIDSENLHKRCTSC